MGRTPVGAWRGDLGRGLISSDPYSNGGESEGSEEVSCEFVVASGDGAEVFEFVEEAFDEVALAIELRPDRVLDLPGLQGGDVRRRAVLGDQPADRRRVIAPVGDGVAGRFETGEQRRDAALVRGLAGAQHDPERQTALIDHGVDLGAQPAAGTADGVIRPPFFPPAACWWARTTELSIR